MRTLFTIPDVPDIVRKQYEVADPDAFSKEVGVVSTPSSRGPPSLLNFLPKPPPVPPPPESYSGGDHAACNTDPEMYGAGDQRNRMYKMYDSNPKVGKLVVCNVSALDRRICLNKRNYW